MHLTPAPNLSACPIDNLFQKDSQRSCTNPLLRENCLDLHLQDGMSSKPPDGMIYALHTPIFKGGIGWRLGRLEPVSTPFLRDIRLRRFGSLDAFAHDSYKNIKNLKFSLSFPLFNM